MWDLLQSSAFLLDASKVPSNSLIEPLRRLLPCIYCRNSFVDFYSLLGVPKKSQAAQWVYDVHKLVNRKLMKQRAEAFVQKRPQFNSIVNDSHELLSEPKMEVLQKRFLVNREEPICRRGLLTVLLALVMALQLKNEMEDIKALHKFIESLVVVIKISRQYNAEELISIVVDLGEMQHLQDMRSFLEYMKYGDSGIDGHKASSLIKAGACISGTCA
jgi:hypothetical protein